MIEFLNYNQGFVMALLTAVYVIATIILVWVAQRQAKLTQQSIDFAAKAEKAKYRPYLVFDIVYEKIVAYARLLNSGASPALDVKITISQRLKWKDNDDGIGFIEKGVSFLAPNRELSQPFGWTGEFFEQYPDLKFSGTISYKDAEGHAYSEAFSLDLSYLKGMTYIGEIDLGREVEAIKKALEKFHSPTFRPLVRTIGESEYIERERELREAARQRLQGQVQPQPATATPSPQPSPALTSCAQPPEAKSEGASEPSTSPATIVSRPAAGENDTGRATSTGRPAA